MSKGIKKTAKILETIVACIILILAILPILLQNSRIQNFIVQTVTNELSTKLNSKISVGLIEYKLFNTVRLNDFYVEDLEKDTLLFVNEANANFNFWKLFKGKILFTGLEFQHLQGNLKVDTLGHSNLDFVINAFKKPQKNEPSNIEYRIDYLKISDSRLNYSKQNGKPTKAPDILNTDSLRLSDINAEIELNILKNDTLSAAIKFLSFREKIGLCFGQTFNPNSRVETRR